MFQNIYLSLSMVVGTGFEPEVSVTRLGDLLDFGQVFKAYGNN